jgi:drug/metabolite transporter (DMT)-like permease
MDGWQSQVYNTCVCVCVLLYSELICLPNLFFFAFEQKHGNMSVVCIKRISLLLYSVLLATSLCASLVFFAIEQNAIIRCDYLRSLVTSSLVIIFPKTLHTHLFFRTTL